MIDSDETVLPDDPIERTKFMIEQYFYTEYECDHMAAQINAGKNKSTYEPFKLHAGHRAQAKANAERMMTSFEVAGLEIRIKS